MAIRRVCAWAGLLACLTLSNRSFATEGFELFSTAGLERAQGLAVKISVPKDWVGRDLPRPGVVREFRNPSTGGRDALLVVVPPDQLQTLNKDQFETLYLEVNAPRRLFPGTQQLVHEEDKTFGVPAVRFDYNVKVPQLGAEVLQFRTYAVLVGGRVLQLQFYTVGPKDEDLRDSLAPVIAEALKSLSPPPPA